MELADLERALEATGTGVLLVPERILRRVIKRHRRTRSVGTEVPHARCYAIARRELLGLASADELGASAERLAEVVLLVRRPEPAEGSGAELALALWRAAFHASVHRELERALGAGAIPPAALRARIHEIGQTEFDEVRLVLRHDHLLLPPHDDATAYVELAATYLELRAFAPEELARTFPALAEPARLEALFARDVEAAALLAACRPEGAPEPGALVPPASHPSASLRGREARAPVALGEAERRALEQRAAAARERGNHARAALLGARIGGEAHARADVAALGERLARALGWADAPLEAWTDALLPLVARARGAARLPWNVAGQLVYDLQKACVDHEREVFTVGVGTWLVSFGRRPLRRSLPAQREVRIVRRVRAAVRKLARVRIGVAERAALAALVTEMLERAERNLRAAVEPRVEAALRKVGLAPANAAERVAARKVVLELTDGVVDKGFTSIGPLRDALSRGNLKLQNLSLGDLYRGDALLRVDRILSRTLDGVYRRGEAYLRALQILSSILFGTSVGRLFVLYAVLPLAGTYLVLEGSHHMVAPVLHVVGAPEPPPFLTWPSFAVTLAVLFGLLHSALVRRAAWAGLSAVGRAFRAVLWRAPRWLFTRPPVRALFRSGPVVAFGRFVLKPALLAAPLAGLVPALGLEPVLWGPLLGGAFLGWNVLLNSKPGVLLEEVVLDFFLRQWRMVSQRILPGILLAIVDVFRRALVGLDRLMYAVDERLRFRQGEGRVALVVKGILGTVWAVLRYIVRLWVNLFLEPEVNPVKHFPTVAVAAKIVLPLKVALHEAARHALVPTLGPFLTELLVLPNLLVMPGFFGFLVWELQGNWRLYDQNRKPALGPVVLGHHGEGMPRLLRPGFHSGTVPKAFAKLRRASQKGHGSALKHRETLRQVEHALHHFAERELVALLCESGAFVRALSVGHVRLASNRVRLPLESPELGPEPVELAFEEQSGWIVASVARRGWLEALDGTALMAFENALAGFYKLAAVDFVREQLEAALGPGVPYDLASEGLVVWPDGSYATEVVYDLRATGTLRPEVRFGSAPARPLEASALRFGDEPVTWRAWVDSWSQQGTRRVLHGASLLPAGLEARSVRPSRREPRS